MNLPLLLEINLDFRLYGSDTMEIPLYLPSYLDKCKPP